MKGAGGKPRVVWKGGVHLAGTPLWCDALSVREACFLSSARVAEARRHRQVIATDATLKLLPRPRPGRVATTTLAVPYGRPFSLGPLRLELFPSGHVVGGASLAVDLGGPRVVYAGTVNPAGGGLAGAAEVRPCDTLVLDGSFGHPRFRFPGAAETAAELGAWLDRTLAEGSTPVLLADPLATAPDLALLLHPVVPLRAHRGIVDLVRKLRGLGHARLPALRRFEGTPARGEVVLWPADGHGGPARRARAIAGIRRPRVALVSGWAMDPEVLEGLEADAGFALAAQAGWDELIEYVRQTGAREVYLTGGGEELARELAARGLSAWLLGPPRQLALL